MTWDTINHLLLKQEPVFSPAYPQDAGTVAGGLEVFNNSLKKYKEEQVFWEGRKITCLRASLFFGGVLLTGVIAAAVTQTLAPWIVSAILIGAIGYTIFNGAASRAQGQLSINDLMPKNWQWTTHVKIYLNNEFYLITSGKNCYEQTKSELSLNIWKKVTAEFFKSQLKTLQESTDEKKTKLECMKDICFYNPKGALNSWYYQLENKQDIKTEMCNNKELFEKIKNATLLNSENMSHTDYINTFKAINNLIPEEWLKLAY